MLNIINGKSSILLHQMFRYIFSGGVAFVIDISVLWFLTEIVNFHYLVSAVIANIIGLIVTYIFSIYWIFNSRSVKNRAIEFMLFALIGVVGILLTLFFMWLITDIIGISYLISKIITVGIVAVVGFVLKKYILFR